MVRLLLLGRYNFMLVLNYIHRLINYEEILMCKHFILITFVIFLASSHVNAKQQSQQIDNLLKSWQSKSKPGIAVAVNKNNKTVYENYFGVSNLENLTPITSKTKFLIASVSKQFTAFAISILADEKKLSLQDDIRKYIPQLPDYNHKITVMHLLNHTSGLRDSDDLNGLIGAGLSDYVSFNDAYNLIVQQKKLNFIPGSKFDYSNSGYILLAKIVENISDKSFREFMNARVFKPLEMNDTLVFDNPFEIIGGKAKAYFSSDGKNHSANNLFSAVYGSTGIYTTLSDLSKWAMNFNQPKIGNKEVFKLMKTQGILTDGSTTNYGLGQEMKVHQGHNAIFHGGGQGAYRAYLLRFPESNLSVSILSNTSYSTSLIIDYAFKIADMYLENTKENKAYDQTVIKASMKNHTDFEPVDVPEVILKKYLGIYQIQPGLMFTIEQVNNNLQLLITGNEKTISLKPKTAQEFFLMNNNNGYKIVFPESKSNLVNSFSYFQNDFEYIGERVNLVEYDKKSINWKGLEGLYYSEELNTIYSIEYDGRELMAIHARNMPIKLTSHQPDTFNGSATYFQEIKFQRDGAENVTGMLVSGSRSKEINFVKLESL